MKNALISPNEQVRYVSSWTPWVNQPPLQPISPQPIYTTIPNAQRVAEVVDATFQIAPPLFWVTCADDVVQDKFYYDTVTSTILPVPADAVSTEPQTL
jgi:hypothetical protein